MCWVPREAAFSCHVAVEMAVLCLLTVCLWISLFMPCLLDRTFWILNEIKLSVLRSAKMQLKHWQAFSVKPWNLLVCHVFLQTDFRVIPSYKLICWQKCADSCTHGKIVCFIALGWPPHCKGVCHGFLNDTDNWQLPTKWPPQLRRMGKNVHIQFRNLT